MHSLLVGIAEQVDDDALGARITGGAGYYDLNRKPRTFGKEGRNKEVKSSLRDASSQCNHCNEIMVVVTWPGKMHSLNIPYEQAPFAVVHKRTLCVPLTPILHVSGTGRQVGRQAGKEVLSVG